MRAVYYLLLRFKFELERVKFVIPDDGLVLLDNFLFDEFCFKLSASFSAPAAFYSLLWSTGIVRIEAFSTLDLLFELFSSKLMSSKSTPPYLLSSKELSSIIISLRRGSVSM